MLKSSINKLMRGENLSNLVCQKMLEEILKPETNDLQKAAFLVLLRAKQETADELSAFATTMRRKMIAVPTKHTVLDIVGTGGDGHNTVNISTASAMLAASCGIKVAKHGNRSVSSLTGSADVLEAFGININLTPKQVSQCINEVGIGFCFSPNFHPTMLAIRKLRQELALPTSFNILGPLLNPAQAKHLIIGVLDQKLAPILAEVLVQTGSGRSIVVHGSGLDEISCAGPVNIIEVDSQNKHEYVLDARNFGLARCDVSDLRGGDAKTNAKLLLDAFNGKQGPIANALILNTATALYLYGTHATIKEGIPYARENLANGAVLKLLNNWIEFSHDQ